MKYTFSIEHVDITITSYKKTKHALARLRRRRPPPPLGTPIFPRMGKNTLSEQRT